MKYDDLKNSLGVGKVGYSAPFFRFGFVKYAGYLERGFFQGIFDIFRDLFAGCGLIGGRAMPFRDSYARSLSLEAQNDSCWENFSRFKRGMLTLTLASVISLGIASESWADTSIPMFNSNGQQAGSMSCSDAISYCYDCSYDSDKHRAVCNQCSGGMVLSEGGSKCISSYVANDECRGSAKVNGKCEIMPGCRSKNSNGVCTACWFGGGYTLENNICLPSSQGIPSAETMSGSLGCIFSVNTDECLGCAEGYLLSNYKCYKISDMQDCSEIHESDMIGTPCLNNGKAGCADGYYYTSANYGQCRKCTRGPTCHFDPQTAGEVADSCSSGYIVSEDSTGCITTTYQCNKNPNMYFNTAEQKCKYKPDGCKNVNADGSCVANEPCWNGYIKNASGRCYLPVESCEEGKFAKEDQCVSECGSGYLVKSGTTCVEPSSCTGEYLISGNECIKMPGCIDFADGACGGCESGYYKKQNGCVSAKEGCGSGWLEKNRKCIEASKGCGDGYKDLGGWCNRVQYTPAEAAGLLNNDNTNFVTITFRK